MNKMKRELSPRLLTVIKNEQFTPNMQRITFKADNLSDFRMESEGGYIKLLFNDNGGVDLTAIAVGIRPTMRTYTVRNLRVEQNELDVDFVRHHSTSCLAMTKETGGFASAWAQNAICGDTISIAGPGSIQGLNNRADWFYLISDMTGLPALAAKLQALPSSAVGYAVIEINHSADKQDLIKPAGMQIIWVILTKDDLTNSTLVMTVREQQWLSGKPSIWCACEFDQMKQLRAYFRNEREVDKGDI